MVVANGWRFSIELENEKKRWQDGLDLHDCY
jgi:hypothetical protein